ncbi:hypothetical protein OsJ_10478 [Oryza sativa Japonica Group]|uniref:Uncharacterized protein n=1 Tax=Oryza sativa subsp. japonica TaxID=39947 RepID=B9F7U2_ORYSJ|nr:hypothetical protein OsJ_10478 [Oryza sativa Japonica Group]
MNRMNRPLCELRKNVTLYYDRFQLLFSDVDFVSGYGNKPEWPLNKHQRGGCLRRRQLLRSSSPFPYARAREGVRRRDGGGSGTRSRGARRRASGVINAHLPRSGVRRRPNLSLLADRCTTPRELAVVHAAMLVSGRLADDAFAATRLLAAYAALSPPDAVLRLFATSHERRPEFRAERRRNEALPLRAGCCVGAEAAQGEEDGGGGPAREEPGS